MTTEINTTERKKWTRTKLRYKLRYLDCNEESPQWHEFQCATYKQLTNHFQEKYNLKFTRDQLQNILLNRNNAHQFYPNIKITKI
jgi:hypothetical protein